MKRLLKRIYGSVPLKRELFLGLRKIWRPGERIYKHLHFHGDFTVAADAEHSFTLRHHGYFVENEIFWAGLEHGHEQVSYALWKKLVKNARVIMDIGANTGVYALMARSLNPRAAIYAFEPVDRVFAKLETNRMLNNYDFTSVKQALSNYDGDAVIYDTDAEHTYSVTVNKNTLADTEHLVETRIPVMRLDSFIAANGIDRIDVMKIDVETHEPEVLEGMGAYLDQYRPSILIEVLDDEVGARIEALVQLSGYLYFNLNDHAGTWRQVERICKSDFWNYLLCSPSVAKHLGLI